MAVMTGNNAALYAALEGVVGEVDKVRRVVIDIRPGHPVVVHVERFADQRLLDVVRMLDEVEIRTGQPTQTDERE